MGPAVGAALAAFEAAAYGAPFEMPAYEHRPRCRRTERRSPAAAAPQFMRSRGSAQFEAPAEYAPPAPVYQDSAPVYQDSAPVYQDSAPVYRTRRPCNRTGAGVSGLRAARTRLTRRTAN